jgi:hypothetical protein
LQLGVAVGFGEPEVRIVSMNASVAGDNLLEALVCQFLPITDGEKEVS